MTFALNQNFIKMARFDFSYGHHFNQHLECAAPKHWSKYITLSFT